MVRSKGPEPSPASLQKRKYHRRHERQLDNKSMTRTRARLFNLLGPFEVQVWACVCVCVRVCFLICCSVSWYQNLQRKPADLRFQFSTALLYKPCKLCAILSNIQRIARTRTPRNSLASQMLHTDVLSGKLPARLLRLGTTTARLRDRRDQVAMTTTQSARNCLFCIP